MMLNSFFICLLICGSNAGQFGIPEERFLGKAAKEFGVDIADIKLEKQDLEFYGSEKFRVEMFDIFIYQPLKAAPLTRALSRAVLENADSLWALAYFPWARIGEGVRRGLIERPETAFIDSLRKMSNIKIALAALLRRDYGTDSVNTELFSDSVAFGLLFLLSGINNSLEWIKLGISSLSQKDIESVVKGLLASGEDGLSNPQTERMIEQTDFKALAAGAMDLAYFIQAGIDLLRECGIEKKFEIITRYGKIVLGSNGSDRYANPPYLLIIEPGGNDVYESCAVTNKDDPVSIVIDYDGDDNYTGKFGPGTGIGGYGIVADLAGDDEYHADKIGVGTGIFGTGLIVDYQGNDEYSTDTYGEGAGLFGTGVVSDLSGDDKYMGFQGCQGFGFVKGCGLLVDKQGDDIYIARDDSIIYASAQTAEHNVSLSQGAGFGIRADFTDGHSLAGGVGMLIDGNGNDKYSCGVFGQGCGYWYGLGFLIDYQGNDEYDGIWYVQGAGAHFAVGVLMDSTGNDTYRVKMNMSQGAGHDFTLGVLYDYEGNDYYDAPNLSLGAGNANGMGLFIDHSGDDEYVTHGGITLGGASTASRGGIRDYMKTIGIFIDGKGRDRYSEPSGAGGDNKVWKQKPPLEPPLKTEWCIGIDF